MFEKFFVGALWAFANKGVYKMFFVGAVLKVFLEGAFAKRPYIIHSKSD